MVTFTHQIGDRVEARFEGAWRAGTVVGFTKKRVRVQLDMLYAGCISYIPMDEKWLRPGPPPPSRPEYTLRDMICPQCHKDFTLRWQDFSTRNGNEPQTLMIRGCPSGGIYGVSINCPHCNYEEEL